MMTTVRLPRALTAAAAALALLPAAVPAQGVYADQVAGYLTDMEGRLGSGLTLEGEASGWMADGAEGATIVRLPAGSYVAFGACDNDCSDIDLVVSRLDTEEMLDSDREMDSFPIVEFTLGQATDVIIGISMPGCGTARCYVGYRWYHTGGAAETAAVGAGGWEGQVQTQLDALPMPEGVQLVDERTGLVEAGGDTRFSLNLGPGSYAGVAVCDNDCSDIDLTVQDAAGSTVASDVLADDVPVVEFEIAKGGGTHYFEVDMVSCATSSCGFGFRLYRRD